MTQGVAGAHLPERSFEVRAEHARPHVRGQGRLVHADESVEGCQIQGHPAEDGNGAAANPASAGDGRDRDDGFVAGRQHCRDLCRRGGPHDDRRALGHCPIGGPSDGQWPPVPPCLGAADVVGEHHGTACGDPVDQPLGQGHDGTGETIGDLPGLGIDRRDRRGTAQGRSSPAVRSSFWHVSMNWAAWLDAVCSSHPMSGAISAAAA